MTDTLPAILEGDILLVTNNSPEPRTIMWNSKNYTLQPNKPTPIPFEAVALWFGDPRSAKAVGSIHRDDGTFAWVPDRATEVRRLRVKYGVALGDETTVAGMDSLGNVANIPDVTIKTLDDVEVYTVVDDPLGEHTIPAASPTISDQAQLLEMLRRQQRQIEALMAQSGVGSGSDTSLTESDLPSDDAQPESSIAAGAQELSTPDPDTAALMDAGNINPVSDTVPPDEDPFAELNS